MRRLFFLAALFLASCAGPRPVSRADPDLAGVERLEGVIRRKPFRYDARTDAALDGLCALAVKPVGLRALRREYAFLDGVDKGTDRIEACLLSLSSATAARESAWAWYKELQGDIQEAKRARPGWLGRLVGGAAPYDRDKPRWQRSERLCVLLARLLPPAWVERFQDRLKLEDQESARERRTPELIQAVKDYLVATGRVGAAELARLEGGEGVLRILVRWREDAPEPEAAVSVQAFLPFRAGPAPGAAERSGPTSVELRLEARELGERWALTER